MSAPARSSSRWLAAGLAGFAVVEVLVAVGLTIGVGWPFGIALEAFVVTNATMAVAFATCGAVVAWHRPRNAVGWLFVAAGLAHATSAMSAPLLQALHDIAAPELLQRAAITAFVLSWPWSIGLFLPLVLLLFPDGRPPSPRWRPVIIAVIVTAPVFGLAMGTAPVQVNPTVPLTGLTTIEVYDSLGWLWTLAEVRHVAVLALAVAALVLRYRRGDEMVRRQLLWLLLATIGVLVCTVPWSFVAGTPVFVLFAIPLIPVAVAVAIVRYQLLDIRLVFARALAWLLATAAVVLVYIALVAVLDTFVSARLGRSAVATVIVVLLVAPVLPRLQRLVDRAMYGDRHDPARVASRVGKRLVAASPSGLADVVVAISEALRVPYVAVSVHERLLAATGERPRPHVASVVLEYGAEQAGELHIGLRPGERELSAADRQVLDLLAMPLAVAVHAIRLSEQVQASRERIITAREEERRRLRRDLHDGLGPALTGMSLAADAAANLVGSDPTRARELLAALRSDTRAAIADVRRIVEDLRPPALDELGLLEALRRRAEQMRWSADGEPLRIQLDLPAANRPLPAAVETAGYRIATEALTNVVRHARASTAVLRVRIDSCLELEILDDGPANGEWLPGIGLRAMRERADELGGRLEAGRGPSGGRVYASLPLEPT